MYSLSDPRVVFLINKNYNNLIAIYLLLQLLIYYTNIDSNFRKNLKQTSRYSSSIYFGHHDSLQIIKKKKEKQFIIL